MSNHLMNTYLPLPVAFERGEGAWLWDTEGNRYLDAISGLGVCALGHSHPEVTRVISEQAWLLIHSSNLARIPWQEELASKVADVSGMDRVFIANSGTEAIECAVTGAARVVVSEQDRLSGVLSAGSLWIILLTFFAVIKAGRSTHRALRCPNNELITSIESIPVAQTWKTSSKTDRMRKCADIVVRCGESGRNDVRTLFCSQREDGCSIWYVYQGYKYD